MKTLFFLLLFPIAVFAQTEEDICNCADVMLSMMQEAKAAKGEPDKMMAIQEKYKPQMDICQKYDEGKTKAEITKLEEILKSCPSYLEAEKIMKEGLGGPDLITEICDCADIMLNMMQEAQAAKGDDQKMLDIMEKYKSPVDKCKKLDEGKSEEEKKEMERIMKSCPSFIEVEKIMKEESGK